MKNLIFLFFISLFIFSCQQSLNKSVENSDDFTFVFMTDIHLTKEKNATEGFLQAIDTINRLTPDFVLTGGDNIMDALAVSYEKSTEAYNLYEAAIKNLKMPVYNSMGNHEIFGLYEKSGVSPDHKEYGKKMYENRLTKRYYSFDYKNWHFIVLDGISFTDDRHYFGQVDAEQIQWLKEDLAKTGDKPIAVSTHIPLLSVGSQIMKGPNVGMSKGEIVTNADEIIAILEQYNTKLVLQGHLHFLEDIQYNGIHYITGGAVCAQWWKGPRYGMEEGFLKIDVSGEDFQWEYVDFGWDAVDSK
jgi:3',5'-cyclic AMP phosphodiesterase CpdA